MTQSLHLFYPQYVSPDGSVRVKHHSITEEDGIFKMKDIECQTLFDLVENNFMVLEYAALPSNVIKHPCVRPSPAVQDISPNVRDQWEIKSEDLDFVKKLGSGNFGEVWLGECLRQSVSEGHCNTTMWLDEPSYLR